MPLAIIITDVGRAALLNAQNTGTDPVVITEVGVSATAVVPSTAAIALPDEIKRVAAIGGDVVADDTLHISIADATTDIYTLRSFALYLDDGTLFAIYGQADPILDKTAGAMAALSIDIVLVDIAAEDIAFGAPAFTDPPATTEQSGVSELATLVEARAGDDATRTLTPSTAKNSVLTWLAALGGAGSGLDADKLDGQHGAWYADIAARLGYTPLNTADFTGAQILARLLGVDGAGSGLDADRLDGYDSSSFLRIVSYSQTGYTGEAFYGYLKLQNGFLMQWRRGFSAPQEVDNFDITFPLAFTNPPAVFLEWHRGGDATPQVEQVLASTTLAHVVMKTTIPLYSLYGVNLLAIGY